MKPIMKKLGMMVAMLLSFLRTFAYDFEVDGKFYNVISLDEMTCELTYKTEDYNSYSGVVNVPSEVVYNNRTFSVTKIGNRAFEICVDITKVNLPESINEIGFRAFEGCENLEFINLPDNISVIDRYAFSRCRKLRSFVVPSSMTELSTGMLSECTSIKEIIIPASISEICVEVFKKSGIERCIIEDSDKEIKLWKSYINSDDLCINGSFSGANVKYLYLGRNFKTNVDNVYSPFLNLLSLEELVIGEMVTYLPANSFVGFHRRYNIPSYDQLPLFHKVTFKNNDEPLSFINGFWRGYGENNINDFRGIRTVIVERNLDWKSEIGDLDNRGIFSNVKEAWLVNAVSDINDNYFRDCSELTHVYLGKDVSSIGENAFKGTDCLGHIDIYAEYPPIFDGDPGFSNNQFLHTEINVAKISIDLYKNADVWKKFWNIAGFDFSKIENVEIENPNKSFLITQTGITALANGLFDVYSLNGYIVHSCQLSYGESINLPKGIYIVNFDGFITKIWIK